MKAPVGISECLTGAEVRFNGKHKFDGDLLRDFDGYLDFQPICPEVTAGLGVPREPIQLVISDNAVRAKGVKDRTLDATEALMQAAHNCAKQASEWCGFIAMQESPSCAVSPINRYSECGELIDNAGQGIFVEELKRLFPWLPIVEAKDLHSPQEQDNFLTRVFTLQDWKQCLPQQPNARALIAFHSRYKYLLMAHSPADYKRIGASLANLSGDPELHYTGYIIALISALAKPATRGGHTNTLLHIKGYFREKIAQADYAEIGRLIDAYQQGQVALSSPLKALQQLLPQLDNPYIAQQRYWQPHPDVSGLRDHIVP